MPNTIDIVRRLKKKPDDRGCGREKRPVINVSRDDAMAQWEKAARAPAYRGGDVGFRPLMLL